MNIKSKISTITELSDIVSRCKAEGKKIVHCHGVFDLLHIGHIRSFNQAGEIGDVVIVTVSCDQTLGAEEERPKFIDDLRAEAVASLGRVDYVAITPQMDLSSILDMLSPDYYFKIIDYFKSTAEEQAEIKNERALCESKNIRFEVPLENTFSSTSVINKFISSFPEHVQEYIHVFMNRYSLDEVYAVIDKMAGLSVAVIGDSIIDDYRYCRTLGTSSKDPVLAVQYSSHDIFAGGILAVANHVSNFCKDVDVYTVLGGKNDYRSFIEESLNANVTPHFIVKEDAPTIVKRRFVEGYSLNKMFEVYVMDDSGLNEEQDTQFREMLTQELPGYDLVIVADFGHGTISKATRQTISDSAPFLALNTQANSGNRGFNTVTQYRTAQYASIAEHELRLETRDLDGDISGLLDQVADKMDVDLFVVTRGMRGSLVRSADGQQVSVPAFAHKVVDRVGAGDAFLSVTSMAAYLGCPPELLGFIGNIVGALAVEILGNQKSIEPQKLKAYINDILQ